MEPLLTISHRPATCVPPEETICSTVQPMVRNRVGAAAVINPDGTLAGIFTERDLMTRVVAKHRDPETTLVGDAMTTDPVTISPETTLAQALEIMVSRHFRHLPIMDGSAKPFVTMIEQAGTRIQNALRRMIRVDKRISVGDHKNFISLTPARTFSLSFEIDFDSSNFLQQKLAINIDNDAFKSDIAGARTFGFVHEVDRLRSIGLALGGSLENAIVIDGNHVLNSEGLRFQDEFVRHKILDCIGDLYLAGAPIIGHVHGSRSGHGLNHALLQALFENDDAWSYVGPEVRDHQKPWQPHLGADSLRL